MSATVLLCRSPTVYTAKRAVYGIRNVLVQEEIAATCLLSGVGMHVLVKYTEEGRKSV